MSGYQQPPHAILDIVDQPDEPSISFSPDRTKVCAFSGPYLTAWTAQKAKSLLWPTLPVHTQVH